MSRAFTHVDSLEELNYKLEQTIHNLHGFAGRLAGITDNRKRDGGNIASPTKSVERPRGHFFQELDRASSNLATNLGYLDSLVWELTSTVFDDLISADKAPGTSTLGGPARA